MNGFQKFLCIIDGHEKLIFYTNFFGSGYFLTFFSDLMDQKMAGAKKKKIFMPVNYTKEFLKSIHIGIVISVSTVLELQRKELIC